MLWEPSWEGPCAAACGRAWLMRVAARLSQVPETRSDDLSDTAEEVSLKLGLWTGRAEWEATTETWCGRGMREEGGAVGRSW
jgi:hypothetical protein